MAFIESGPSRLSLRQLVEPDSDADNGGPGGLMGTTKFGIVFGIGASPLSGRLMPTTSVTDTHRPSVLPDSIIRPSSLRILPSHPMAAKAPAAEPRE